MLIITSQARPAPGIIQQTSSLRPIHRRQVLAIAPALSVCQRSYPLQNSHLPCCTPMSCHTAFNLSTFDLASSSTMTSSCHCCHEHTSRQLQLAATYSNLRNQTSVKGGQTHAQLHIVFLGTSPWSLQATTCDHLRLPLLRAGAGRSRSEKWCMSSTTSQTSTTASTGATSTSESQSIGSSPSRSRFG